MKPFLTWWECLALDWAQFTLSVLPYVLLSAGALLVFVLLFRLMKCPRVALRLTLAIGGCVGLLLALTLAGECKYEVGAWAVVAFFGCLSLKGK